MAASKKRKKTPGKAAKPARKKAAPKAARPKARRAAAPRSEADPNLVYSDIRRTLHGAILRSLR
jgi:hypothetical protein